MLFILGIVIAVVLAIITTRIYLQIKGSNAAIAQFELPEDSDKESFMDPKTGKRYDKEGYEAYLDKAVKRMTDPQLANILKQYGSQQDIWNQMMCQAIQKEQQSRAEAAENAAEQSEEYMEQISEEIAPFFWVEQSTGASVGLATGAYLQEELFGSRGLAGSGQDWDALARIFLRTQESGLPGKLEFDSQEDLFSVYSRDTVALEKFIRAFKDACEDPAQRAALLGDAAQ